MNLASAAALVLLASAPPARAQPFEDQAAGVLRQTAKKAREIQAQAADGRLSASGPSSAAAGAGCVELAPPADVSRDVPPLGVAARINGRDYPSVFQAWHGADNLNEAPFAGATALPDAPRAGHGLSVANVARHDLAFFGPGAIGLKPVDSCAGLAIGFTADSVSRALAQRREMLAANPHLVLLAEIRWHDGPKGYLPADSPWWQAGDAHQDVPGEFHLLKVSDPEFREHVALQCKAAILTGVFDGCMFDWWSEGQYPDLPKLAHEVRVQIGDEALILVNANNRREKGSARDINGFFMEGFDSRFWPLDAQGWATAEANLVWQKQSLHAPVISALEGWAANSRGDIRDVQFMRALTALALTRSDGFVLFGDKNTDGLNDHRHDWYPFWNKGLGRPAGEAQVRPDGAVAREYEGGTVVYNPAANQAVTVRFPEPRFSRATHLTASAHAIVAGDGDIFEKTKR